MRGCFYGKLNLGFIDGNMWRVTQYIDESGPFGFDMEGAKIEPSDGFCTDFASIPAPVRWMYPKAGGAGKDRKYGRAAVIHDWLYSYPQGRTQKQCDDIFKFAMECDGVKPVLRNLFYTAVRIGGKKYFGKPNELNKLRSK